MEAVKREEWMQLEESHYGESLIAREMEVDGERHPERAVMNYEDLNLKLMLGLAVVKVKGKGEGELIVE